MSVAARGRLYLVGLGPGSPGHMTERARQAVAEAEVVVGYATYLALIPELLAGKAVVRKGMTEERERVEAACAEAAAGRRVALVSSGDAGVYGMAGPAYEHLLAQGWRPGEDLEVEVVPGTTALAAAAALAGAPLTHDFCTISLSDLLTPWPAIARRLEAAARGDFVIALYNPASRRRTEHLRAAQRILLRDRAPGTPVAVVRAAYREGQGVEHARLDALHRCAVDMLTTVIVGSSASFARSGVMVTPRGYTAKYAGGGERRGRSLRLGLAGWPEAVRAWLREQPEPSLDAAAQYFDVPWGELLAAVDEAMTAPGDPFRAAALADPGPAAVAAACRGWGPIEVAVPGGAGARLTCLADGRELRAEGGGLTVGDGRGRAELGGGIGAAWRLRGPDGALSLELVDRRGEAALSIRARA